MNEGFRRFSQWASHILGTSWAFAVALGIVVVWVLTGPIFNYSDTWQLAINTGTTVVTFLMVFIIQNTQNRDSRALHIKLDELLRAVKEARTELVDLEEDSDEQVEELQEEFRKLHKSAAAGNGPSDKKAGDKQ